MRLARALGLITMVLLLAVPSAGAQLPVGEADGVRIVRERGIVVVFTPQADKLWRRVAGRRVSVLCTDLPPAGRVRDFIAGGGVTFRAPKRGRRLRTGDLTRGLDYCRVALARRRRMPLVSIPLTQVGAVYLDEEAKARSLGGVLGVASAAATEGKLEGSPTYAQLIAFVRQTGGSPDERFAPTIVALAGPGETPPPGKVGYYSDGEESLSVVVVSRSGRRLFIAYEPNGVLSTNVASFIFGDGDL